MAIIKFKTLYETPVKIFEASGVRDDYINVTIAEDTPYEKMASAFIYAEGGIRVERIDGVIPDIRATVRNEGDCTLDDPPMPLITKGTIQFIGNTDTFKWYCINHPNKRRLTGAKIQLEANQSSIINAGNLLFLAKGSITGQANDQQMQFTAPCLVQVIQNDLNITANEPSLLVRIDYDQSTF